MPIPMSALAARCLLLMLLLAGVCANSARAQFDASGVQYLSPLGVANNAVGRALAAHPDGRLTVAGIGYPRGLSSPVTLMLRRYNVDGTLDPSFDFNLEHSASIYVSARSLLALPDGGLLLAYTLVNPNAPGDASTHLIKLTAAGSPAVGFTPFSFNPSQGYDEVHALALQADGRILMAGSQPVGSGSSERLAVALRLNANGSLDTDFASEGYLIQPGMLSPNQLQTYLSDPAFYSINLLADGRIQLVGSANNSTLSRGEVLMVRLLENGNRDPSFNDGEPRLYAHLRGSNLGQRTSGNAADVSPEGVIVVGGFSTAGNSNQVYLWQFDASGALMTTASDDLANVHQIGDVQLLPNSGVVAVGSYTDTSATGALVAVFPQGLGFSGAFIPRFSSSARDHSLSALAYLPDSARLLAFGTGITERDGQFSSRWVLTENAVPQLDLLPALPPTLRFEGVAPGAVVDSGPLNVPGVNDSVRVPLRVRAGELEVAANAVTSPDVASPRLLWANSSGNPAALSLRLRHTAAATLSVETITRLELGGVVRSHNHALTVGSTAELRMESLTGQGAAIFADGFELP
jgi:uncharacterized delta-60 repeat protein